MQPQKRATGIGILIGLVIVFVAVLSVRCNEGESPVSFTPDLPDASTFTSSSSSSNGNPGVQPTPTHTPAKQRYAYDILSNEDFFRVEITSTGATSGRVGIACYENPDRTSGANQKYFSSHIKDIVAGATRTPQAKIPKCVAWQCDAFEGDPITNEDPFYGRRLIVGRSGDAQGSCAPPPPPVCQGEECDPPPPPSCEDLLRIEVQVDGEVAWIYLYNAQNQVVGSEHRELTRQRQQGEVCVGDGQETLRSQSTDDNSETCCLPFTLPALPPPPPTCEEQNPETIFTGSGTSRVENREDSNGRIVGKKVTAQASGGQGGAAFSGEIGILWRLGSSKYVKAKAPTVNRCGQRSGITRLSWTSTSSVHTSCDADYSLIWYTNGNRSNPDIQNEISLNKTGLCND